jgi:hypothetical protein
MELGRVEDIAKSGKSNIRGTILGIDGSNQSV